MAALGVHRCYSLPLQVLQPRGADARVAALGGHSCYSLALQLLGVKTLVWLHCGGQLPRATRLLELPRATRLLEPSRATRLLVPL